MKIAVALIITILPHWLGLQLNENDKLCSRKKKWDCRNFPTGAAAAKIENFLKIRDSNLFTVLPSVSRNPKEVSLRTFKRLIGEYLTSV